MCDINTSILRIFNLRQTFELIIDNKGVKIKKAATFKQQQMINYFAVFIDNGLAHACRTLNIKQVEERERNIAVPL